MTSKEVSADGKTQTSQSLATTDLVQDIPGGKTAFSGKNEEMTKHSHDGDDKNFTSSSGHTSNTVLNEQMVTGDENSQRFESRSNMSTSSSTFKTSKQQQQQQSVNDNNDDHKEVLKEFNDMINMAQASLHTDSIESLSSTTRNTKKNERYPYDSSNKEHFSTATTSSTNQTDKLTNQQRKETVPRDITGTISTDGEKLLSRAVDYPDAYTKVITETKSLPDGTIVTTKRYETKGESSSFSKQQSSSSSSSSSSRMIRETHGTEQRNETDQTANRIESTNRSTQRHDDSEIINVQKQKDMILSAKLQDEDIRRHEELRRAEFASFTTKKTENKSEQFIRKEQQILRDEAIRSNVKENRLRDQSSQVDQSESNKSEHATTSKTVKKDLEQQFVNESDRTSSKTTNVDHRDRERVASEHVDKTIIIRDQSIKDSARQENKVQTIKIHVDIDDRQEKVNKITQKNSEAIQSSYDDKRYDTDADQQKNKTYNLQQHDSDRQTTDRHLHKITKLVDETDRLSYDDTNQHLVKDFEQQKNKAYKQNDSDRQTTERHVQMITKQIDETDRTSHDDTNKHVTNDFERQKSKAYNLKQNDSDRQTTERHTQKITKQIDETDRESITSELTEHNFENIDYRSKKISVDHQPTHDTFARSLRCASPPIDRNRPRSTQSSGTSARSSNQKLSSIDRNRRSPSRDTEYSELSQISSNTVTKSSYAPPDSRRPVISSPNRSTRNSVSPVKNQSPTRPTERSQKMTAEMTLDRSQDSKPEKSAEPVGPNKNRSPSPSEEMTTPEGARFCGTRDESPAKSPDRSQNYTLPETKRPKTVTDSDRALRRESPTKNDTPSRPEKSQKLVTRNVSPSKSPDRKVSPNRVGRSLVNPTKGSENVQRYPSPDAKYPVTKDPERSDSGKNRSPTRPEALSTPKNRSPKSQETSPVRRATKSSMERSPERPNTDVDTAKRTYQETLPERRSSGRRSPERVDSPKRPSQPSSPVQRPTSGVTTPRQETSPDRRATKTSTERSPERANLNASKRPSQASSPDRRPTKTIELDICVVKPTSVSPEKLPMKTEVEKSEFLSQKTIHIEQSTRTPSYAKPTESFARHTLPAAVHVKPSTSTKVESRKTSTVARQLNSSEIDVDADESIRSTSPTSTVSDLEYVHMANTDVYLREVRREDIDAHDGATYSHSMEPRPTEETNDPEPFFLVEREPEEVATTANKQDKPRAKIPYTRSETYEERCRAMLGMNTETTTKSSDNRQLAEDQPQKEDNLDGHDTVDFVKPLENQQSHSHRTEPKEKSIVGIADDKIYEIIETVNKTFSKQQENAKELQSIEDRQLLAQEKLVAKDETSTLYENRIPVVEEFIQKESAYVCGKKTTEETEKVLTTSKHSPSRPSDSSPERRRSAQIDAAIAERANEIEKTVTVDESSLMQKDEKIVTSEERSTSHSPGRKPISAEVHPNKRMPSAESPDRKKPVPFKESPKADRSLSTKSPERKKVNEIVITSTAKFSKTQEHRAEVAKQKPSVEPDRKQPTVKESPVRQTTVKPMVDTPRQVPSKDVPDQRRKPQVSTPVGPKQQTALSSATTRENSNRTKEITANNVSSVKITKLSAEMKDVRETRKTLGTVR